jgi:hypothetical protein
LPAAIFTGENVWEEVEQAGLLPRRSLIERVLALHRDSIPYRVRVSKTARVG